MIELAVSNIAWGPERDEAMLGALRDLGYTGLEVAPTRLFPDDPYSRLDEAAAFAENLKNIYGLSVCSMQSIWFGRGENIFESEADRAALLRYTERAAAFAGALRCRNLVFGCPKNRVRAGRDAAPFLPFARAAGDCAGRYGAKFSIEANPPIYGTDFIGTTPEALWFAREADHPAVGVNLDLGAVIQGGEDLGELFSDAALINHVHVSEPHLAPIERRPLHRALAAMLRERGYRGFVSIEMKNTGRTDDILDVMAYLREVFA